MHNYIKKHVESTSKINAKVEINGKSSLGATNIVQK
jgi:hypothetical protein